MVCGMYAGSRALPRSCTFFSSTWPFGLYNIWAFEHVCFASWWLQPGWNILHKSKWESSPSRGENKEYIWKPPPSLCPLSTSPKPVWLDLMSIIRSTSRRCPPFKNTHTHTHTHTPIAHLVQKKTCFFARTMFLFSGGKKSNKKGEGLQGGKQM